MNRTEVVYFLVSLVVLMSLLLPVQAAEQGENMNPTLSLLLSGDDSEIDCNGVKGGTAYLDNCNICVGGNTGEFPCKTVFISSSVSTADLGGLSGADDKCIALAANAGLSGEFKAWLSTASESPSTRFTQSAAPYVLTNGTVIANDWDDLVDGVLQNSISVDESGNDIIESFAWSGTATNGVVGAVNRCTEWTHGGGLNGTVGLSSATDGQWTLWRETRQCAFLYRLYCFEQ